MWKANVGGADIFEGGSYRIKIPLHYFFSKHLNIIRYKKSCSKLGGEKNLILKKHKMGFLLPETKLWKKSFLFCLSRPKTAVIASSQRPNLICWISINHSGSVKHIIESVLCLITSALNLLTMSHLLRNFQCSGVLNIFVF